MDLSWIDPEAVNYSKFISLSRKTGQDTEYVSVSSTIMMDTLNSSKTIPTEVNDDSVASTRNLSKIILDTTLYHYLDTLKKSPRCSVHRWLGIE